MGLRPTKSGCSTLSSSPRKTGSTLRASKTFQAQRRRLTSISAIAPDQWLAASTGINLALCVLYHQVRIDLFYILGAEAELRSVLGAFGKQFFQGAFPHLSRAWKIFAKLTGPSGYVLLLTALSM
jgi:hypothetical protein